MGYGVGTDGRPPAPASIGACGSAGQLPPMRWPASGTALLAWFTWAAASIALDSLQRLGWGGTRSQKKERKEELESFVKNGCVGG